MSSPLSFSSRPSSRSSGMIAPDNSEMYMDIHVWNLFSRDFKDPHRCYDDYRALRKGRNPAEALKALSELYKRWGL